MLIGFTANQQKIVEETENIRKTLNVDELSNMRKFWNNAVENNATTGGKPGQKPEVKRFKGGVKSKRGSNN